MKRIRLSLLFFIFALYWNNASQATSILSGSVFHEGLFDQIYADQDVEWIASEVMQEGALITSDGNAYDSSYGEWSSGDIGLLQATAESFNLDVGDSYINVDDGKAGYFNEFYTDVYLATNIEGNSISSTYLNFQADNRITVTQINNGYDSYIPYRTWSSPIFDLYFKPDALFLEGFVNASGEWVNDNITQTMSEILSFSVDFIISADGITILNQDGIGMYSSNPDEHGGYWIRAWYTPDYMHDLAFNVGDISNHSVQMDFTATICESHPVPEPTTIFLLGTGIIGIAGFKRKFKKGIT